MRTQMTPIISGFRIQMASIMTVMLAITFVTLMLLA